MKRCLGALARVAQHAAWMTLLAVTACANYLADESDCSLDGPPITLPGALRETSGVAAGIRNPSLVWTHNDRGNRPVLYAVDRDGQVHARIELNQPNDDWEDVARGRCDLGACLYVAGTGDNEERRDIISFYRLAEPDGEGDRRVEAERYRMVLPDGPRDIEAMYVLPTDQIFFVTKGRNHPVTIYRYPSPLRSEGGRHAGRSPAASQPVPWRLHVWLRVPQLRSTEAPLPSAHMRAASFSTSPEERSSSRAAWGASIFGRSESPRERASGSVPTERSS